MSGSGGFQQGEGGGGAGGGGGRGRASYSASGLTPSSGEYTQRSGLSPTLRNFTVSSELAPLSDSYAVQPSQSQNTAFQPDSRLTSTPWYAIHHQQAQLPHQELYPGANPAFQTRPWLHKPSYRTTEDDGDLFQVTYEQRRRYTAPNYAPKLWDRHPAPSASVYSGHGLVGHGHGSQPLGSYNNSSTTTPLSYSANLESSRHVLENAQYSSNPSSNYSQQYTNAYWPSSAESSNKSSGPGPGPGPATASGSGSGSGSGFGPGPTPGASPVLSSALPTQSSSTSVFVASNLSSLRKTSSNSPSRILPGSSSSSQTQTTPQQGNNQPDSSNSKAKTNTTKQTSSSSATTATTAAATTSSSSTTASAVGRRRKASKPDGYVRRPSNAWIIFRSDQLKLMRLEEDLSRQPQANISGLIAQLWKDEKPEVKQWYEREAELRKQQHAVQYPNYVYSPIRKKGTSVATSTASTSKCAAISGRDTTHQRLSNLSTTHDSNFLSAGTPIKIKRSGKRNPNDPESGDSNSRLGSSQPIAGTPVSACSSVGDSYHSASNSPLPTTRLVPSGMTFGAPFSSGRDVEREMKSEDGYSYMDAQELVVGLGQPHDDDPRASSCSSSPSSRSSYSSSTTPIENKFVLPPQVPRPSSVSVLASYSHQWHPKILLDRRIGSGLLSPPSQASLPGQEQTWQHESPQDQIHENILQEKRQ